MSTLPAPVLSLDSAVVFSVRASCNSLVSPAAVLTLSLETPRRKENYEPFSARPSCGDHVATMAVPSSSSYEIEAWNLLRKRHSRL